MGHWVFCCIINEERIVHVWITSMLGMTKACSSSLGRTLTFCKLENFSYEKGCLSCLFLLA